MTDKLKTCPFCGGEAFPNLERADKHWVECRECAAESDCYATEAEAIAAWNARAERTCSIDGAYYDELWEATCTRLSCGHDVWSEARNYCPECGARIEVDS